MDRQKKEEGEYEPSPFDGIQKSAVLHEARIFSESQLNPYKCCEVLKKILFLLIHGESFTTDEATNVFFGVTKLFQSQNSTLRRMVYLVIKELSKGQDNVFVVINCLSKDMTGTIDLFRANAIRVFAKVIDGAMLGTMERFLKQAIVHRDPHVASSALMAGQELFTLAPDTIKRWVNEVQEALSSPSRMVQYHALSLLYKIKQHDKLAIIKVVTSLSRRPPKSPLAQCLLLRFILKILRTENDRSLLEFVTSCLHNRNSMVMYEAARGLCFLPNATAQHITPAIVVLQELLNSALPAQRFAAVRTLSLIVTKYPLYVTPCSVDLELLITDSNRGIATLAITTLLKTGVEASVDRLMKTISGFMSEVDDELKIVLIEAIRALCLRFPQKYTTLMIFLASVLREEGGFEYKQVIVESIVVLMEQIKEAKESGLEHLCEFIEDCEFYRLSVRVLGILAVEGPKTSNPAKYIRFIFNRVILELPVVRAAAVDALTQFALQCPELTDNIETLLTRALYDDDDQVRDRVIYNLQLLGRTIKEDGEFPSLTDLQYSVRMYLAGDPTRPFTLDDVVECEEEEQDEGTRRETQSNQAGHDQEYDTVDIVDQVSSPYLQVMESIPELACLGEIFRSTSSRYLTESEAEYVVSYVKHIFPEHVVLQFTVVNHLEGYVLDNVTVDVDAEEAGWPEDLVVPSDSLRFETEGVVFVCLQRPDSAVYETGSMGCVLKFLMKEDDEEETDQGIEDEYQLEDLHIGPMDFIKPHQVMSFAEFRTSWEQVGGDGESVRKLQVRRESLQEAVDKLIQDLGVVPIEESGIVSEDAKTHAANLAGVFLSGQTVLVRAGFLFNKQGKEAVVTMKIAIRTPTMGLAEMITNSLD